MIEREVIGIPESPIVHTRAEEKSRLDKFLELGTENKLKSFPLSIAEAAFTLEFFVGFYNSLSLFKEGLVHYGLSLAFKPTTNNLPQHQGKVELIIRAIPGLVPIFYFGQFICNSSCVVVRETFRCRRIMCALMTVMYMFEKSGGPEITPEVEKEAAACNVTTAAFVNA
ncbi:MAG: hypothetical protein JSS82_03335 [Bacteroidetes bacterium]|nr:hypothetical protein [Bacteroidota bacterium]